MHNLKQENSLSDEQINQKMKWCGFEVPKEEVKEAPALNFGLELFLHAFYDLCSCRQVGMGEGAIPWTAIREYCFFNRFEDETIDDMLFMIPRMDMAYLKYRADEMKKESKNGK